MTNNTNQNNPTFEGLGIAPKLFEMIIKNKFTTPTPIQLRSIPIAIEGKDLMGIAQTGTGKTMAFGIPMIQRLAQTRGEKKGLILVPTRELALQVDESLRKIGTAIGLRTAVLIGGEAMGKQLRALKLNPNIIVATPGRINDHLENSGLNLSNVGILVLDEADRMLDMGFAPQIEKILKKVPKQRQTMLFSATMPDEIVKMANSYMLKPLRVEVAPAGTAVKTVTQELFFVEKAQKNNLLHTLLSDYKGSVLVFSRTKYKARDIARLVRNMGHTATEIHSNRSLGQRKEALEGFKLGKYRVLVATDIAARGIDVTGIELVINFDLPATAEDYVHRIGRTGRAGMTGRAITFAQNDQKREVRSIERLIQRNLPVSKLPESMANMKLSAPLPDERPERGPRGGRFSGGSRGGRGSQGGRRDDARPPQSRGQSRGSASGGFTFIEDKVGRKPSSGGGRIIGRDARGPRGGSRDRKGFGSKRGRPDGRRDSRSKSRFADETPHSPRSMYHNRTATTGSGAFYLKKERGEDE
jgi:ATP-dependent RNA helicase RhlE